MTLNEFLSILKKSPEEISFSDTIATIDSYYHFSPSVFTNGTVTNKAGENAGSCKIFSFAKLHTLSKEETLACFGSFYREDVLGNPNGTDHQNIRNFMIGGWEGITFENEALSAK